MTRQRVKRSKESVHSSSKQSLAYTWISFLLEMTNWNTTWLVTLCIGLLLRWTVSLGPYSGEATPPTFGDYEAQRHWMEITLHLPPRLWYFYKLDHWGLDYPPLSAYVSWLCGYIGSWFDPSWFALDTSRGIETPESRVFMRSTVIVCELLVYIPAVWWYVRTQLAHQSKIWQQTIFFLFLIQPSLIMIDHGHFQYNSVMLGFTLLATVAILQDRFILGAVFFCLALMFKQMALYYAPAVFAFLLGKCFRTPRGWLLFIQLGLTVIVVFGIHLLPFTESWETFRQVFIRIFPVSRGLYEDKVANIWCALSVLVKLRDWYSQQQLLMLSLAATILAFLPACIHVGYYPTRRGFIYALANTSLAFFLLSFQVHEKTILIPLLPITLLYTELPSLVVWFTNVATFSMYPLLHREGSTLQWLCVMILWNLLNGLPSKQHGPPILRRLILASYVVMICIFILHHFGPLPAKLPHLYIVMNVVFSAGCFSLTWLYLTVRQWTTHTPIKRD